MPSLLHEGVLELIRERPGFVADLLRELLQVDVPAFDEARLTNATLSRTEPAVVLFVGKQPVFGCIIEAQLAEDATKSFSWPVHAVSARARYQCPFVLVVVTPSESVAAWAARPIALGGGRCWAPLVLWPNCIPLITDEIEAIAEPELALLSALAHARDDTPHARSVAAAALAGVASTVAERQALYFHLLRAGVGDAARERFDRLRHYRLEQYLAEDERQRLGDARARALDQGRAEGRRQGLSAALARLLEARRLVVSSELKAKIEASSSEQLLQLLGRAAVVGGAEELLR